ncbi:MAG: PA2169 family four-helix-bundle protein [Hyphomonadaceae bacterium JAD_PAG50586_4]|nr:MAG: PA2169 family four-helix-bundle protein [Hyphomonadaceae bacterium JAD_PAG50586_4]
MARYRADIAALNQIAGILVDTRKLYARAARLSDHADALMRIERTMGERAEILDDVRNRVRDLSGTPKDDGSVRGAAQMVFLDLRSVFDRDFQGALAEVERGEEHLRSEIRRNMRRDELHAETRAFLGVLLDRIVSSEMRLKAPREELDRSFRPTPDLRNPLRH